jgi:hypothetical protein
MASKLKLPEEIDSVKMMIKALAARRKEGDSRLDMWGRYFKNVIVNWIALPRESMGNRRGVRIRWPREPEGHPTGDFHRPDGDGLSRMHEPNGGSPVISEQVGDKSSTGYPGPPSRWLTN